jgi:hypothetical protein
MQEVLKASSSCVTGTRASRIAVILALAVGLMAADSGSVGHATPVPIAFDDTGTIATTLNVTGAGGGTMALSLAVGGPLDLGGSNNFSLDVFNAASATISSVNFVGLSQLGGSFDYGDATAPTNSPLLDFAFYDVMTWSVTVAPADLSPLTLSIFSTLTPASGPLAPLLTVAFTGDLQLPIVTPLPGTLPLFMTGIGVLGLLGRRRRNKAGTQRPELVCTAPNGASTSID